MVVKAYLKTGLVPQRRVYCEVFAGVPCGCAIGALTVANDLEEILADRVAGMCIRSMPTGCLGLEYAYLDGFQAGFDYRGSTWFRRRGRGLWDTGFNDGMAAAEVCFSKDDN